MSIKLSDDLRVDQRWPRLLPEVFFRFQKLKLAKLYESGLLEDSFVQILQK